MSDFNPVSSILQMLSPDPSKHVNYSVGMVLGVDDFTQEFTYLSRRDRWMARDLIGYGTVSGLAVTVDTDEAEGPRVTISPGIAVSPCGQMIRVVPDQCAYLNAWIAAHKEEVIAAVGSPPAMNLPLYVVLSYRESLTDSVPIPGEPGRSEDELIKPSRVSDSFLLELRLAPPPRQPEEDALRDFVRWLGSIDLSNESHTSLSLVDFLKAIRDAVSIASPPAGSPPYPDDFMIGSPPSSLHISTLDACEYFRAAFCLWVTEIRPRWHFDVSGSSGGCTSGSTSDMAPNDDCLLLAQLNISLTPVDLLVTGVKNVRKDETRRPYVLHLRVLQEMLSCIVRVHATRGPITSPPQGSAVLPQAGLQAGPLVGLPARPMAGPYTVAAGIVQGDGTRQNPVYKDLRLAPGLIPGPDGELKLTFDGYVKPDGTFRYIVKALPIANTTVDVNFLEFLSNGFSLSLLKGNAKIPAATIASLSFMVEVSRIDKAV
jgi:hypothetical protein